MCSHPDHEVVTLPDGSVDETHVFTDAEMADYERALGDALRRMRGESGPAVSVFVTTSDGD